MKTENQIRKMIQHLKDGEDGTPENEKPEFNSRHCMVFLRYGLEWACGIGSGEFEKLYEELKMVDETN